MANTEGPRSFARFVERAADGDMHADASEALFELGGALQDQALKLNTKVKGKITLTMNFSCDPRGIVGFDYDIAVKKPKTKRASAIAWVSKQGNLVFEDPRQASLPYVREVKPRDEAIEPIDVNEGAQRPAKEV